MNDTLNLIKTRRSTKKFKPTPVPQDLLDQVIEAGVWSATGKNAQAPIILAVTNKELRDKLSAWNAKVLGADIDPFYGAPAVLVVLAKKDVFTHVYDGSLVMGNLMLEAHALGLGSCWIHRAKEMFETEEGKALLKSLGIEDDYEGIGNCVLGYPADGYTPPEKPRKANWVYRVE